MQKPRRDGRDAETESGDWLSFAAVIEYCKDTNLYVGHVPGIPGAHSQGATLDELNSNLQEVLSLIMEEDGDQ